MKSVYFSNLNGFRAIASIAVILADCSYWIPSPKSNFYGICHFLLTFNGGEGDRLGVLFFFILSGFLITYLLFSEIQEYGRIYLRFFYFRRFFRIWPLYFLVVFIGFFIFPFVATDPTFNESASIWMYVFFLANFDHIYNYFPASSILGVQWSVSVEEQFYLFWPLIIRFLTKTNYLFFTLLGLIFFSEFFYLIIGVKLRAGEYHLISCMKYLSGGALLAHLCFYRPNIFLTLKSLIFNKQTTIFIYILSFGIMFSENMIIGLLPSYKYFIDIIPILFFMFVIVEQNFSSNSFYKISNIPFLDWLGKISYGMYLLHMIIINAILIYLPKNGNLFLVYVVLTLLTTIVLSHFSYTYFENYFLRLSKKYKLISSEK